MDRFAKRESGRDYSYRLNRDRLVRYHRKRLNWLGFKVTIEMLEEAV